MIKHLQPRSNEEIEANHKDSLIRIARSRIAHDLVFNKVIVYINAYEISETWKPNEYYEIKFFRKNKEWEYVEHIKHTTDLMHKDWFRGEARGEIDGETKRIESKKWQFWTL